MRGQLPLRCVTLPFAAVWVFCCIGCSSNPSAARPEGRAEAARFDIREAMLVSAKASNNFPGGKERVLTQFAYIGSVATQQGPVRVAACRSVLAGMLSPRGQAWLSFHAADGRWIGSAPYEASAPPLWCSGSRVYFFGMQGAGEQAGNALDLREGVEAYSYVVDPKPGSWTPDLVSGGTTPSATIAP